MDDALLVRRLERGRNLRGDRQGLLDRYRTVGKTLREVVAFDELHDQGRRDRPAAVAWSDLLDAINLRDMRVIQRRERLRLAGEARHPLGVRGEQIRQDLDGDVAVEPRVAGAEHFAHAAGTEGG